ncbi:MAG TPA: hypothetical protein VGM43_20945 [Bryobacteraceae bacterium]|jgi:hypothetical protein
MSLDNSPIHFQWKNEDVVRRFRTGVSLHGHTLHSRESLDFIERATARTPWFSGAIRKQMRRYREKTGRDLDLSRAWWTPPLSALQAWKVEKAQIEGLGLAAQVSLSDHDNADAGVHLSVLEKTRQSPVSVEWTVPWRETFFHVGLHNLPVDRISRIMPELARLTERPLEGEVADMLAALHDNSSVLIIWNHPLWDEGQIGAEPHRKCAESFLARMGSFVHAFELNGLRPWKENQDVIEFAEAVSFPVISGGDRHGREPNACLNPSNAASFRNSWRRFAAMDGATCCSCRSTGMRFNCGLCRISATFWRTIRRTAWAGLRGATGRFTGRTMGARNRCANCGAGNRRRW